MAEFEINTGNAKKEIPEIRSVVKRLASEINQIEKIKADISKVRGIGSLEKAFSNLLEELYKENANLNKIADTLEDIIELYEEAEKSIQDESKTTVDKIMDMLKEINKFLKKFGYNGGGDASEKGGKYDGDPVSMCNGNYISQNTIISIPGMPLFSMERYYNALKYNKSSFGIGWSHNFEASIEKVQEGLLLRTGDGSEEIYVGSNNSYVSKYGSDSIILRSEIGYIYETEKKNRMIFDLDGKLLRMENANGNALSFLYDESLLQRVSNEHDQYMEFEYNEANLLSKVSDSAGRECLFEYKHDFMTSYTDVTGNVTRYKYSSNGLLEQIINSEGICVLINTYDDKDRVIKQAYPDASEMTYQYNDAENAIIFVERNGQRKKYIHDEKMRHVKTIFDDGSYEKYEYNDINKLVVYQNREGNKISYRYDGKGNRTGIIDAHGNEFLLEYDDRNNPIAANNADGSKAVFRYDNRGNVVEKTDPEGNITRLTYNEIGRIVRVTAADDSMICITYDARGNMTEIVDARGKKVNYKYDELNRVIETIDGNGNRTQYEYDNKNNLHAVVNAEGNRREYTYNATGRVKKMVDFDNFEIENIYNAINRIEKTIDKLGNVTSYQYDKMWNISEITDALGYKTSYRYNADNCLIEETDPAGNTTKYEYDILGNKTAVIDTLGNKTELKYDELSRLVAIVYPDGLEVSFAYDCMGNIVKRETSAGIFEVMSYFCKTVQQGSIMHIIENMILCMGVL